ARGFRHAARALQRLRAAQERPARRPRAVRLRRPRRPDGPDQVGQGEGARGALATALRIRARHSAPRRDGDNDVDATGWYGALAPAGTPPAVIARLHKEFAAALQ